MKTVTKLFFIPLLCVCSLLASCSSSNEVRVNGNGQENPDGEGVSGENSASIYMEQTVVALVKGANLEVPFRVELKKLAKQDLALNLEVQTSCYEGVEYTLPSGGVSIKEGEKLYRGVLTLKADGFPFDTKKEIKLKLSSTAVVVDPKNTEVVVSIEKPSIARPGISYAKPTNSFACTSYCSRFSIGGIAFEKIFDTQAAYEDMSAQYIACVAPGENRLLIETDRAAANAEFATYNYKLVLWGDWNGDGDFDDPGEQCVSESWTQDFDGEQYTVHDLKFKVPEDAVKSSVIRMGMYQVSDNTTDMKFGAGNMDNGNLKDITYLLVDAPVALKPLAEADKPQFSDYCITVEFFYSYAEIRTFQLNGKTIRESSKGDPLETDLEKHDDRWDAWGSRRKLQYVQKLKRGQQNVFEFTAERHIDIETCDQRYRGMIYVDWNGDNDFCDEGEEILQEEWFAEWLATSHPKQFLGYLTPPANAVKSSRIRFGVYSNRQSYIKGGCGGGNNTDIIDILYQLED